MIYTLGEDKINGATSAPFIKTKYFNLDYDINSFDIIIFTSKKAIISLDKACPSWINKIIYTVGKKTKEFALSKGATNVASSKKESSYDMIGELQYIVKNKKVLYIRAKKTLTDIKSKLNNLCDFTEIIAYETIFIKPLLKLKKGSIIIFSSPSTIKSFSCFYDIKDFKVIVIGKSTAKSLDTNIKYEMPSSPSLELCIKKAKEMLKGTSIN
jgi:uroporphyrinogen-III synthase